MTPNLIDESKSKLLKKLTKIIENKEYVSKSPSSLISSEELLGIKTIETKNLLIEVFYHENKIPIWSIKISHPKQEITTPSAKLFKIWNILETLLSLSSYAAYNDALEDIKQLKDIEHTKYFKETFTTSITLKKLRKWFNSNSYSISDLFDLLTKEWSHYLTERPDYILLMTSDDFWKDFQGNGMYRDSLGNSVSPFINYLGGSSTIKTQEGQRIRINDEFTIPLKKWNKAMFQADQKMKEIHTNHLRDENSNIFTFTSKLKDTQYTITTSDGKSILVSCDPHFKFII